MQDMIKEGNVYEVNNLYENVFPKLTEQFFKTSPWPEAEEIAPYVNEDPIFLNLYRELYYRHIYARVQVILISDWMTQKKIISDWFREVPLFTRGLTPTTTTANSSTTFSLPRHLSTWSCLIR